MPRQNPRQSCLRDCHPELSLRFAIAEMKAQSKDLGSSSSLPTSARCAPKSARRSPVPCPSCGMALEPETSPQPPRAPNTPAPCTRKSCATEPGACPICGMALEPRTVAAKAEENPELRDMTRRFWVGVVLTTPLAGDRDERSMLWPRPSLWAALLMHRGDTADRNAVERNSPLARVRFSPRRSSCGAACRSSSASGLRCVNRRPNMFTLIGLGTGVAYVRTALVATIAPGSFSWLDAWHRRFRGMTSMSADYPDVYFESAAAIVTLVLLGQVMELRARSRTSAPPSAPCSTSARKPRGCSSTTLPARRRSNRWRGYRWRKTEKDVSLSTA
jgi:Cu+-exporting ATPase